VLLDVRKMQVPCQIRQAVRTARGGPLAQLYTHGDREGGERGGRRVVGELLGSNCTLSCLGSRVISAWLSGCLVFGCCLLSP